jgi:hypothetical protein
MVLKQFQRHFLSYGRPWTFPKTIPNTTTSFPITTSLFFPIHQEGYEKGFFFFITWVQFISIFYDVNKSKYWLSWGELAWAYLNMFSNILMIFYGSR